MKRIIIAICIFAYAMSTQAQNKIFSKYASMDDISFVCINKAMLNLGASFIKTATGDDSLGKLSNIDNPLIISAENVDKLLIISAENEKSKKQIDKDINALSNNDEYEILMISHSKDGDNVFIFSNKRKPHELIIGSIEKLDSSMIVIVGNFTKEEVVKLIQ